MIYLNLSNLLAVAAALDQQPCLKLLLMKRAASLGDDLLPLTECLVVQAGDTEADIEREIGSSPLSEPYDGARYGAEGYHPHWDWLIDHGGWYEMCLSFGSSFARLIFVEDVEGAPTELRRMCRRYTRGQRPAAGRRAAAGIPINS